MKHYPERSIRSLTDTGNSVLPVVLSLLFMLFYLSSCTTYQDFNREQAYVFNLNDSSQIAIGPEFWKGTEDCSAEAFMNRTETGLLLTIFVKDDSVRTGNEFSYMNDGVEIYLDLRPPRLRKKNIYEKGVFQAVVIPLPGKKNSAPISWYPVHYPSEVTGARASTKLSDSSYTVQILFPYSSLRRNHYWPRTNFSMDIAINDADSLNRETQMIWKGKSDNWNKPLNFYPISVKDYRNTGRRQQNVQADRPNILMILTSRQTAGALASSGNPFLLTPGMDALAAAGIQFNQAYCTSLSAAASLNSILTGIYPSRNGLHFEGQTPDSSVQNLGQLFKQNGYRTLWGGKWGLPDLYPHVGGIDSLPGFELIDFLPSERTTGRGSDTDSFLADAMAKQLQRHPDEPWLMVVSLMNPHDIENFAQNPDAYLPSVHPESNPPLPLNFTVRTTEPESVRKLRNLGGTQVYDEFKENDWRNYLFQYYRMVEKADLEIMKMIQSLEKQGYDENTLIVFTSETGDGAASHAWAGSYSPYEAGINIPLVIAWFGREFTAPGVRNTPVSHVDVLPTLLDYAGIPVPEGLDGKSLRSLMDDPSTRHRELLFCEIMPDSTFYPPNMILRYRNYKFISNPGDPNNPLLFDLKNDPLEMTNLADLSEYRDLIFFLEDAIKRKAENR